MKNTGGVLLLGVVCGVAVASLYFGGKQFNSYSKKFTAQIPAAQMYCTASETNIIPDKTESVVSKPTASALPAAAKENALGAVEKKFYSAKSGGLYYNLVGVKNKTSLNIDLKAELEAPLGFKLEKSQKKPQVLIVHTHTTEGYMSEDRDFYTNEDKSRSTNPELNMIAVGEVFAAQLQNAGIGVIHAKTVHDYPSYNGSYNRSAQTVSNILKANPDIKVVIDLHRDAIASGTSKIKPVAEISGKTAAQVMLVMGCQDGKVTGFENWRQNFRLAVKYQQIMEANYSGLARAMVLAPKKYNEHLTTGSLLLEVGTDGNTLEEAKYSAELSGKALAALLNSLK